MTSIGSSQVADNEHPYSHSFRVGEGHFVLYAICTGVYTLYIVLISIIPENWTFRAVLIDLSDSLGMIDGI